MLSTASLATVLALTSAHQATPELPTPRPFPVVATAEPGQLTVDLASLEDLIGLERASFRVDLPGGASEIVDLRRARRSVGTEIYVDGQLAGTADSLRPASSAAWVGEVRDQPGSTAIFALSPYGARGMVSNGEETFHLLAERPEPSAQVATRSSWMSDRELADIGSRLEFECGTETPLDWNPDTTPIPGFTAPASGGSGPQGFFAGTGPTPVYVCELALETDFAFFQKFGDVVAAADYALLLNETVSEFYVLQVGAIVDVRQVSIYSSESIDPFDTTSPGGLLNELQGMWTGGGLAAEHDLGHVLSGHPGGGVAYVNTICNNSTGIGASAGIGGNLPLPLVQGPFNWDFVVYSHELGHNFGTSHTHNYCPPLDQCAPSDYFGQCQSSQVCQQSTVMSYCHLCSGGINNIQIAFHPTVKNVIRNAILSKGCLTEDGVIIGPSGPPSISSIDPPVVPAVVVDGPLTVTLNGNNLLGVNQVRVDGELLSDFPPTWDAVSKTQLVLQLPLVGKLGDVEIEVTTNLGVATETIQITTNGTPTLELANSSPTFLIQLVGLEVYIGGAPGDIALLVISPEFGTSSLPGLVDLDIGANFNSTIFVGSKVLSPTAGWAEWNIPLNGNLPIGFVIYAQGAVLRAENPVFPLEATNWQAGTVLF